MSENHKKVSNLNFLLLFDIFVYSKFSATFTEWDFIPLKSWEDFLNDGIKFQTVIICLRLADFRAYFYPTNKRIINNIKLQRYFETLLNSSTLACQIFFLSSLDFSSTFFLKNIWKIHILNIHRLSFEKG